MSDFDNKDFQRSKNEIITIAFQGKTDKDEDKDEDKD